MKKILSFWYVHFIFRMVQKYHLKKLIFEGGID